MNPIAFFVYKRPQHTRKALEALIANEGFKEDRLHIFCDGPKTTKDHDAVKETRSVIESFGLKLATIKYQSDNQGLANSIIQGVTSLCRDFGTAIVIEDDLITSPNFLTYMDYALEGYRFEESVMQVSGYMFSVNVESEYDAVLLPFTTSWGWATWERAWHRFDASASGASKLYNSRSLRKKFDLEGAYPYFRMLQRQLAGKIDSWAIRWYLSVFLQEGLTLFPKKTLVLNSGMDGSGTHCKQEFEKGELTSFEVVQLPAMVVDSVTLLQVQGYLRKRCSLSRKLLQEYRKFWQANLPPFAK